MSDLVYMTIRDPPYRLMLAECIASLREVGNFTGEILVVTRDVCPVLHALTLPPFNAEMLVHSFHEDSMRERILAMALIPGHQYRTVTALDADILCFRDFAPVITDDQHVRFMEERWQTLAKCHGQSMYTAALSPSEQALFGGYFAVNAGHVTIPGHLYDAFAAAITPEMMRLKTFGADQAALNAVLRRGAVPCRAWDPLVVGNGPMTPEGQWPQHVLIHYAGWGNAEQRLGTMRAVRERMRLQAQAAASLPEIPLPLAGTSNRRDRERMDLLTPRLRNFR